MTWMFYISAGLLIAFLIRNQKHDNWSLLRGWLRPVSSVAGDPAPATHESTPGDVMSPSTDRRLAERYQRYVRHAFQRAETQKREVEAQLRSAEAHRERDIKERMDRALQRYAALPRVQKGRSKVVEIPDSLLVDLMGINEQEFYRRLKHYRADHAERERLRALPHDPELEAPYHPLPAELLTP